MKLQTFPIFAGMFVFLSAIVSSQASAYDCDASCQAHIEQGVHLYNQFEYEQAKAVFQAEADKGNAHAIYWFGVTQYATGKRHEAGQSFLKAAEMGNPWAMDILVPDDYTGRCEMAGWPCDEKWAEKALKGWEKLAVEGNGKAMYAYFIRRNHWWKDVPFYSQKKYNELYGDIIENGGYGILTSPIKVNDNNDVINYLLIAANDDYPYAMVSTYNYYDFFGKEDVHKWIFKALNMGYYRAAEVLYYFHSDGSVGFNKDYNLAYYYNKLATRLGSKSMNPPKTKEPLRDENDYRLKDEDGNTLYKVFVSQVQQDAMDEKVEQFLQRVKPNRYLDETTHELFR